jgi:hypothetical protein
MRAIFWLVDLLLEDDVGQLTRHHLLYDVITSVLLFCLINFSMRVLIRAELKINPDPIDGFKFRLRATRVVIFAYSIWIGYRFVKLLLFSTLASADEQFYHGWHYGILLSLIVGIPVIIYNLINYQKPV